MARYYYYYRYPYLEYLTLPPFQLCVFCVILLLVLAFSWYIFYDSILEDLIIQLKLFLLTVPLLLLLLLHLLSFGLPFLIPFPAEQAALHRAGASPWGVALLLMFLLYMISHQSHYHRRWFPFGYR